MVGLEIQLDLTNIFQSIFRAIEHNTFLIRSANKGVSAIINNKGEVVKINPNEAELIQLEIPLLKNQNKNKNDLIFLFFIYIFLSFILQKK